MVQTSHTSFNIKHPVRHSTRQVYAQNILRVLHYLQDNLDTPLSLEQLAATANFSPYHFHRIFEAHVGETVMEHIRRLRLERAALKLTHETDRVASIAIEAGYTTHESFIRSFGRHFSMSPTTYRQTFRRRHKPQFSSPTTGDASASIEAEAFPEARIQKHPERYAVFSRHVGNYSGSALTWQRVIEFARQHNLITANSVLIGIAYDTSDITKAHCARYDLCITTEARLPRPAGDIGIVRIPASTRAVFSHRGSYGSIKHCYQRIYRDWLPQSGRILANAPCYEIYYKNLYNSPSGELLTDICVPIASPGKADTSAS